MNTNGWEITEVPLQKLLAGPGNVRKTGAEEGVDELAASIAAVGLLHNLVVKKEARGRFSVIAGGRRLQALAQLAEAGIIPRSFPVPCRVITSQADLTEVSLSENVMREAMHPADECEAFRQLVEKGRCAADIAARFGVSEAVVNQRLALARVSPALLEKYRAGEMNLELLQAFTLTDNHERQEKLWQGLPPWDRNPTAIRRLLLQEDVPATDKQVRFVGLAAYEAAGGRVKRDLFAEDEQGVYLLDSGLLHRLVNEKLTALAEAVQADGWKWVEVQPDLNQTHSAQYRRVYAPEAPLSPDEQAQMEMLARERAEIEEQLPEEADDNEEEEVLSARLEEIGEVIRSMQQNRKRTYSDLVKANGGVLIGIGFDGQPKFVEGLLRKEDERALALATATDQEPASLPSSLPAASEKTSSPYSAPLIEALTTHKTAALAAELAKQPTIALAAVAHAWAWEEFRFDWQAYGESSSLQISHRTPSFAAAAENSPACLFLAEQRQSWFAQLPTESADLWHWCLEQDQDTLLRLLAFCAARSVNAIQTKLDCDSSQRLSHGNALGLALRIDMAQWFTPTADNFFSKVSKSRMVQALAEAGTPLMIDTAPLKKADLAARAEKAIQNTGWLPEPLRITPAAQEQNSPGEEDELQQEAA